MVLVMIGLSAFGTGEQDIAFRIVEVAHTGAGLLAGTAAAARWVLPRLEGTGHVRTPATDLLRSPSLVPHDA